MTDWKTEVCGVDMPQELELVSPDTYIQRKNIHFVVPEEDPVLGESQMSAHYECTSRFISITDYNNLKSIESMKSEEAVDAYTMELIREGVL